MDPQIIVFGLNPAFQRTLHLDRLAVGDVNRAQKVSTSIGGKGQNFAIAAHCLRESAGVSVFQIVGGRSGAEVCSGLDRFGITHIDFQVEAPTRICTTVLDASTGEMTELIEPSGALGEAEVAHLASAVEGILGPARTAAAESEDAGYDGIALCGTFPRGVTAATFVSIAGMKREGSILLMDAVYGAKETLATGKVDFLKINLAEGRNLAGKPGATVDEVARALFSTYTLRWIALTDGPHAAYLFDSSTKWAFALPSLASLFAPPAGAGSLRINPLGAGDTAAAVLLITFLKTRDPSLSYRRALAAASASCLETDQSGLFSRENMQTIFDCIAVTSGPL